MSKKDKKSKGHPWRDNIEAVTVSIITIVLFKYFILEAYKIPTGSMQPTLMGNPETGIFDRVLVDKLSYHYRDPERFEIVVFRYPLDHSKNFIKRIVGMPNEELEVRTGDVWTRPVGGEEWTVLRRPDPVYDATLKRLRTAGNWSLTRAKGWTVDGDDISATGPGKVSFPPSGKQIRDIYTDGYPGKIPSDTELVKKITARKVSGGNNVGDLRVDTRVSAGADCSAVLVILREGDRHYALTVPGPTASETARPMIELRDPTGRSQERTIQAEAPYRLPAGKSISIRAQNLDDLVELIVDGDRVASMEVGSVTNQRSSVTLETQGGGAEFRETEVFRDIYYIESSQKYTRFTIPDGNYLMLGDNTQDSSDSRDWQLTGYQLIEGEESGREVWGNERRNDRKSPNPWIVPNGNDPRVFFYDELGERHVFNQRESRILSPRQASFVPRELIRGRAVVVVWPIVPSLSVYRLKWVR